MALATLDVEGDPHCIGIAYAKVVAKNKIIITDNFMRETPKNLKRNNKITLAVWNKDWERKTIGFELRGKAKYFSSGKWKKFVERMKENRGLPAKGAILVTVSKIKKLVC